MTEIMIHFPLRARILFGLGVLLLLAGSATAEVTRHLDRETFLREAFEGDRIPDWELLMLTPELKQRAREILGHEYQGLRVRYWRSGERTAWILEEIGKKKPITMGIVIKAGTIRDIKILVYRESRGGEVHRESFRTQFRGLTLDEERRLSGDIDGITGATLSVDAVTRVSRLALTLHQHVMNKNDP